MLIRRRRKEDEVRIPPWRFCWEKKNAKGSRKKRKKRTN